jgi:hypothetical protein
MILRWGGAGVLEAVKGFRRLKGKSAMPSLIAYLGAPRPKNRSWKNA